MSSLKHDFWHRSTTTTWHVAAPYTLFITSYLLNIMFRFMRSSHGSDSTFFRAQVGEQYCSLSFKAIFKRRPPIAGRGVLDLGA